MYRFHTIRSCKLRRSEMLIYRSPPIMLGTDQLRVGDVI
jgi:hypothetical protein